MAMKRIAAMLLTSVLLLSCVGCAQDGLKEPGAEKTDLGLTAEVKPATDFTAKANTAVYDELDFDDKQEYEFATRGLIDAPETLELKDENGTILWSQEAYAFLDDYEKAPDSVNPSLWENTKNNHAYGLFEVTDGIYQVRGYDMANLTVVKGDTGWIVFDTLMSVECSQAAMQLIEKNLGKFPVKAVIISHSHADHFGGIAGVMAKEDKADETLSIEDQLASGKIPVITPVGFTEHSVKENVYAGKGMGRRSNYQYGILLTPGVTGKLAQGIGMGQSTGTVSFMTPSYEITQSGEKLTIDGVELEFEPDALKAIAAKAIARKSGARGLRAIIEDALMGTMFDLPSRSDVAKVVVTPEVIAEGKEPTLVPGEPKRKLPAGKTRREGDSAAANRRPSVS